MHCIFCKSESLTSKSVEHIFPESLGNTEHILENGIVCDKCNQYFASKIEKLVLETPYFVNLRHRNDIASKKNRIPIGKAFMGGEVSIEKSSAGRSVIIEDPRIVRGILDGSIKSMIIPASGAPESDKREMSRFLGKIAFEILASRVSKDQSMLAALVREPNLDPIRTYIRFGGKPSHWSYSQRRIHPEGAYFINKAISDEVYQTLHEAQIIAVNDELVAVIGIMGIEYAINLQNPNIDSYKEWLISRKGVSPLEDGRVLLHDGYPDWQAGDGMTFVR